MKKYLAIVLLLLLPVSAWAAKLPVVASFSILADMTRQVGGDRVEVTSLVGPDQDAHVFQPSPSDVKRVAAAKVFVVNGLGFEGWMERLKKSAGFKGTLVVASQGIKPLITDDHGHDHGHNHGHGVSDPHAWHDLTLAQVYVRNIANGLIKADPAGKAYYQQRADAYIKQIAALNSWVQQTLASIPAAQRKVLTTHDAFAYLGKRYQVQFLSVQGVSTDAEPSAKTVAGLIRQIRQNKVKAVFLENMTNPRLINQLSREAGVKVQGKLYADALSQPNGPAGTFLQMVKHNVTVLAGAMR